MVAQVRFKNWQVGRQIFSFQYPVLEAMDTKRVAKVMYSGPFAPSTMRNTGFPKESSKIFIDISNGYRLFVARREKIIVRIREHMDLLYISAASIEKFLG
jgi:hypothetical protein